MKLINGDCLQVMSEMDCNSIDVVVTSPPYNIGIKYGKYDDTMPRHVYLSWLNEWADCVFRILKDDGSFFLNIGGKPTDPWVPFHVAETVSNSAARFKLQNTFHWIKSISIDDSSFGHYKPINSERFVNDCHEFVFHFTKSGNVKLDRLAIGVPYKDKSNIKRWGGNEFRCQGNNWYIPYETIQSRDKDRPHPAAFPVKLAENCIKLHGLNKKPVVLDPFMGIGTSAIACMNLGVEFIGIDVDENYYNEAVARVEKKNK